MLVSYSLLNAMENRVEKQITIVSEEIAYHSRLMYESTKSGKFRQFNEKKDKFVEDKLVKSKVNLFCFSTSDPKKSDPKNDYGKVTNKLKLFFRHSKESYRDQLFKWWDKAKKKDRTHCIEVIMYDKEFSNNFSVKTLEKDQKSIYGLIEFNLNKLKKENTNFRFYPNLVLLESTKERLPFSYWYENIMTYKDNEEIDKFCEMLVNEVNKEYKDEKLSDVFSKYMAFLLSFVKDNDEKKTSSVTREVKRRLIRELGDIYPPLMKKRKYTWKRLVPSKFLNDYYDLENLEIPNYAKKTKTTNEVFTTDEALKKNVSKALRENYSMKYSNIEKNLWSGSSKYVKLVLLKYISCDNKGLAGPALLKVLKRLMKFDPDLVNRRFEGVKLSNNLRPLDVLATLGGDIVYPKCLTPAGFCRSCTDRDCVDPYCGREVETYCEDFLRDMQFKKMQKIISLFLEHGVDLRTHTFVYRENSDKDCQKKNDINVRNTYYDVVLGSRALGKCTTKFAEIFNPNNPDNIKNKQ